MTATYFLCVYSGALFLLFIFRAEDETVVQNKIEYARYTKRKDVTNEDIPSSGETLYEKQYAHF